MKKLVLALPLLLAAATLSPGWAQTPGAAQTAVALDTETVYSDADRQADESAARRTVRSVLAPVGTLGNQYSRWKQPVCFNVYGLAPRAKYAVERRMREVAQQVGAPLDRADPCVPNVAIVFTPQPQATLKSIAQARNYLVPGATLLRSRLREAQPIQAWYATVIKGANGRKQLLDDGYNNDDEPHVLTNMNHLANGFEAEIGAVTVLVDSNAVLGMSLRALADHFALLSLAEARVTRGCKDADSIANLMYKDCDASVTAQELTLGDRALLTGIYSTPDERLQLLHQQRVVGNMRQIMEAQLRARERPANLDFESGAAAAGFAPAATRQR